jgi:hypothetical protein
LPGIEALDEVLDDLEGWGASSVPGQTTHSSQANQSSQLPFTFSTRAVEVAISLPFGFGSQGGLETDINTDTQVPPKTVQQTQTPAQTLAQSGKQTEVTEAGPNEPDTQSETVDSLWNEVDETPSTEPMLLTARPVSKSNLQHETETSIQTETENGSPTSTIQSQEQLKSTPQTTAQRAIQNQTQSETESLTGPKSQSPSQVETISTKPQTSTANDARTTAGSNTGGRTATFSAAAMNREAVYAVEDETVYHDFGDAFETSEVIVDFDELMDPATTAKAFDPDELGATPDLMPARALPLNDVTDPTIRASVNAGFDALSQARWLDAADAFRVVCEARPGDAASLNNHGLALLQKALIDHATNPTLDAAEEPYFQAAILTLRQAALADRRNSTIMHNLATSLASAGRHETALPIFRAALTLDSDDVGTMNNLAATLVALGDTGSARSLLQRASDIDSGADIIRGNLRRLSGL